MNSHFVIAIDGPSGTGKSTTARLLAKNLGITYLDTGAMYRAIALVALDANVSPENTDALKNVLQKTEISFDGENHILINGVSRETDIRSSRVSSSVSLYSAIPEVREALTEKQREFGSKASCVLDGRDIGTVVFPNAQFKFFLVTDLKVRAKRRMEELLLRVENVSLEEVMESLAERDEQDSNRKVAPLRKAEDAIEIDTTHLTIEQQVEKIRAAVSVGAALESPSHNQKK